MKRKSYLKNILREIKDSFGRFMAIFSIVALGTGFLAGLIATAPDMRESIDAYYDNYKLMDIRVISTLGLTDDDVKAISKIKGVESVMPSYGIDAFVNADYADNIVTKIYSLPNENQAAINELELIEGEMPKNSGECVVLMLKSNASRPSVGDIISLSEENEDLSDSLSINSLKVTGIAKSSYYFSIEKESATVGAGIAAMIAYTPQESFSAEAYSEIFVRVSGADVLNTFDDEYTETVDKVITRLENIGDRRRQIRYDYIVGEATGKLDDAKAEYNSEKARAKKELADGLKKLNDGEDKIVDNEASLNHAEKDLESGRSRLTSSKFDISAAKAERDSGYDQYYSGLKDYNESKRTAYAVLDENQAKIDGGYEAANAAKVDTETAIAQLKAVIESAPAVSGNAMPDAEQKYMAMLAELEKSLDEINVQLAELDKSQAALNAERKNIDKKLSEAQSTLDSSLARLKIADDVITAAEDEISLSESKLALAENTISSGRSKLKKAKSELQYGQEEYDKNKKKADDKFKEAEAELADAERKIEDIEYPEWYVLGRDANVSYVSFKGTSSKVEAVAVVFPVFFFLVAALVALTTMTRMIDEQRTQIGTFKALGYSKRSIALKYVIYASIATLLGSAFGLAVGMKVLPTVIWHAYGVMYYLPDFSSPLRPLYLVVTSSIALVCIIAVTLLTCRKSLSESAASLMLPKAPKAGKRVLLEHIPFIWSKLKFTHKVTVRNILRYKKRFFMTVVGIAGCSALLLAGFGLRDAVNSILDKQYGEICHYNLVISLKSADALSDEQFTDILADKNIAGSLSIHQENGKITADGEDNEFYIYVPKDIDNLSNFITLKNRKSGESIGLTAGRAVVSEKMAETLGLSVGDKITVTDSEDKTAEVTVGGITENYVQAYLYMTPELYKSTFERDADWNFTLVNTPQMSEESETAITERLLKLDSVSSVSHINQSKESFVRMLQSIDYIVIVLIIAAGMLAFVVLYNLTNINITERERELATIKVLGFYDGGVASYIYRETGILTVIGTALGLVLGVFLNRFIVKTAEVDMVMFGREIHVMSFVWAALLTFAFSALVDIVMFKKLKKIDMVKSLKSGE